MRSEALLFALLLAGCSEAAPLIEHGLWQPVDAAADPFDDRPEPADCPSSSWAEEQDSLEVDTGQCAYLLLTQPSLTAVSAGDLLSAALSHAALEAEAPAEAHVVVRIGEQVILEAVEPIPSDPADLDDSAEASEDLPEGTPVWLHLHNHGDNAWNVHDILVTP